MNKILINIVILIVPIFILNCSSVSQIVKPIPNNPTSFVFNTNIERVQEAVKSTYYKIGYWGGNMDFVGDSLILSNSAKKVFNDRVNENDFYFSGGFFPKSSVYLNKDQKPLPFWADFHIHITSKDSISTKVEVFVINPRIEIGKKILPSFPHFGDNPKYKSIAPTTIEEYKILLKIGEDLGIEEEMPKLIKP